jgi:hypothetical protein
LKELFLIIGSAAGTLVCVAWKSIALEALYAVGMKEMGARKQINWPIP